MRHDDSWLETVAELARARRGALIAVARREGLDAEDALEVVQDALFTLLRRPAAPESALASVKAMTRNAARNLRRRHYRRMPHDAIDGERLPGPSEPGAEELIARGEDLARLRVCMAELCATQRAAVTLRLLEERSGEDVAHELGLTRGYVDVLVHRAKATLRACMAEPGEPCSCAG